MNNREIKAIMAEIAPVIREFNIAAMAPVLTRLTAIETRFDALPTPKNGEDADPERVAAIVVERMVEQGDGLRAELDGLTDAVADMGVTIASEVARMFAVIPTPKDGDPGKSVTVEDVAPLIIAEVAKAVSALPPAEPGEPGKSVDPAEVEAMVLEKVDAAVLSLPVPENGKDADHAVIAEMVREAVYKIPEGIDGKDADPELIRLMVTEAVAALPPANDGKDVDMEVVKAAIVEHVDATLAGWAMPQDGKSVTVDDLRPLVEESVAKAVSAIPAPKDGVGQAGALIDREGNLVLTMTDGRTTNLGAVVGKDVDMEEVARLVSEKVAAIPAPRDGTDGLGFDDMTEELADDGRTIIRRYQRGDQVKEFRHSIAVVLDRGVFKEGTTYVPGDGVTWAGSFWIAQEDTTEKPDTGKGFRLAVKRGRDGKDGIMKPPPNTGPVKVG